MESIGERAKAFREGKGWSYTRMAAEVSAYSDKTVGRQLIAQLEAAGDRKPHYIAALAKVMGVTTDDLHTGAVSERSTAAQQPAQPSQRGLAVILSDLSEHLRRMPASTRRRAGLLLSSLADSPGGHAEIAAMLEAASGARTPEATVPTPEIPITSTPEQDRRLRAMVAAKNEARKRRQVESKRKGQS